METPAIFNPLDKQNLGRSISAAILAQPIVPLKDLPNFIGAGIYAIYYTGKYPMYQPMAKKNRQTFSWPIYAGKAVPAGSRKGAKILDSLSGNELYKRLNDHRKSILEAENLDISDFFVRYLIVDDIWIPLGESVLIQQTRPIWNNILDGFGNHAPGTGRIGQSKSPWDTLHPGRSWAKSLPEGKTIKDIEEMIHSYYLDIQYNDSERFISYC